MYHETTLWLYRFRFLTYSSMFNDQFFNLTYLQGSNSVYDSVLSYDPSQLIFDFILTDTNLESYSYTALGVLDGSYISNGYTLNIKDA